MDGQEIATAKKMKRDEAIEFDFYHHSMLEIVGETKGVIQFNNFEVLSCQSTTAETTPSTWRPWSSWPAAATALPRKYTQKMSYEG